MKATAKKTVKARPREKSVHAPAKKMSDYDKDFFKWTKKQATLLKQGALTELDIPNLIEEIESLGRNDRRALKSQLTRLLMHLLKQKYQPAKQVDSSSWTHSIVDATREIKYLIEDSPSLRNELKKIYSQSYEDARHDAAKETNLSISDFPKLCPWDLQEILPFL